MRVGGAEPKEGESWFSFDTGRRVERENNPCADELPSSREGHPSIAKNASTRARGAPAPASSPTSATRGREESTDRVFDRLDGASLDALARGLGCEHLLLLRKGVDTLMRRLGCLRDDDELGEARHHEDPCLLELRLAHAAQRLDDEGDLLERQCVADRLVYSAEQPSSRSTWERTSLPVWRQIWLRELRFSLRSWPWGNSPKNTGLNRFGEDARELEGFEICCVHAWVQIAHPEPAALLEICHGMRVKKLRSSSNSLPTHGDLTRRAPDAAFPLHTTRHQGFARRMGRRGAAAVWVFAGTARSACGVMPNARARSCAPSAAVFQSRKVGNQGDPPPLPPSRRHQPARSPVSSPQPAVPCRPIPRCAPSLGTPLHRPIPGAAAHQVRSWSAIPRGDPPRFHEIFFGLRDPRRRLYT